MGDAGDTAANAVAKPLEASPSVAAPPLANGAAKATAPAAGPAYEILLEKVKLACGGNVERSAIEPKGLEPIRRLIEEGFDLEHEILVVLANVKGLKEKLRTFSAGWIGRDIAANRAARGERRREDWPNATAPQIFVGADTSEWRGWVETERAAGRPTPKKISAKAGVGNFFPARWPPGYERAPPGAAA